MTWRSAPIETMRIVLLLMVLLKGEFDLVSNQKEEDIRRELEGIFQRKYPNMYDFEFVKRDRHTISKIVLKKARYERGTHKGSSYNSKEAKSGAGSKKALLSLPSNVNV